MSDPFTDLATALAPFVGNSTTLAGIILGFALTVAIFFSFLLLMSAAEKGHSSRHGSDVSLVIGLGLGIGISYAVGWFPVYIPILMAVVLAYIVIDPLSGRKGASG